MVALDTGALHPEASTRDRLLEAAVDVFVREGYERARVSEIARSAGLTTGAIYAQYRGKADLMLDAISTRARVEVDALLTLSEGVNARDTLRELGMRLTVRDTGPVLLVDAVSAARRDDALAERLRELVDSRERLLLALIERAQAAGDIDPALEAPTLARFCLALAFGAMNLRSLDIPEVDPDSWRTLLTRLLGAVAPPPTPAERVEPT